MKKAISVRKRGGRSSLLLCASLAIACVCCAVMAMPTLAYNYDFSTGDDTIAGFGKATSSDEPVSSDPMGENIRRNKDAAYLPPPYFYGSGDIPTDPSSLYHDNLPGGASAGGNSGSTSIAGNNVAGGAPTDTLGKAWSVWEVVTNAQTGGAGFATGTGSTGTGSATANASTPPTLGFEASTSSYVVNTAPWYYDNGSIGKLYISRTNKTVTVYEGEQLANLAKGAGHFSTTSAWDGNVALCGHNRGSAAYFSFVKDMKLGDTVTYTTRYGVRTYEVISKQQINEYDHTSLAWSAENLLTLITCVEDVGELRWSVQLREVVK